MAVKTDEVQLAEPETIPERREWGISSLRERFLNGGLPTVLFVLAFVLRIKCVPEALPYTHSWDEPLLMNPVIRIMKTGDLNPHFFKYPTGYIYAETLAAAAAALKLGKADVIRHPEDIRYSGDTKYMWTISHPLIYEYARGLTAILGALTVVVVFYLGRTSSGLLAGIWAALLLALSPAAISHSAVITTDAPAGFFVTLALLFSVRIANGNRDWSSYIWAGLFTGLAAGVKYNGALVGISVLVAHLAGSWRLARILDLRILAYGVITAVCFLLTTPYALLDFSGFFTDLLYQVRYYSKGLYHASNLTPWASFLRYVSEFRLLALNWWLVVLAFAGMIAGFLLGRRSAQAALVIFAIFYLRFFSQQQVHFFRNMIPLLPLVCLFIGQTAELAFRNLPRLKRVPAKWSLAGLALLMVLPTAALAFDAVAEVRRSQAVKDSRQEMLEYILGNLPANSHIAVDRNLYLHIPPDLKSPRLAPMELFNRPLAFFKERGYTHVLTSDAYEYSKGDAIGQRISSFLNGRFQAFPLEKKSGQTPLRFSDMPKNPVVVLRAVRPATDDAPLKNWIPGVTMRGAGDSGTDFIGGAMTLWSSGTLLADVMITSPTQEMVLSATGTSLEGVYPQVKISAYDGRSTPTVIAPTASIGGWGAFGETKYPVRLTPGVWRIEFVLTNGTPAALNSHNWQWRRFGVKAVKFQ